jgi:hydroxyacylglutathione hydrolase
VILEQYCLGCLAHASYLIADPDSGAAAVVDPQRDVDQYLQDAERHSCRLEHVFLTHFHADFIAGHLELRERVGAQIHLGARARAEYPFTAMYDGDEVRLGAVRLVALETPGHSPESISILVYDSDSEGEGPDAVLTGDTLFIGDVGRPDLRAAMGWSAEQLAGMLYDSLHEKLAPLPETTLVYPAHGAGSLCGKSLSTETVSTVGMQRKYNYALQQMSRERFVELVTTDLPDTPAYFSYDAVLNARERPTLEQALARELEPLSLEETLRRADDGTQLLDTREPADFEGAHLRGAVNVGLGGSYATWCGTVLEQEKPIVLITDPGHELEAATRLGRIGFDTVAGYLEGGMGGVGDEPELIEKTSRLTAQALAEQISAPDPPQLLAVRAPGEFSQSRIEGAHNVPLGQLDDRSSELPADREVVVYCGSGYRSSIAASLLQRRGRVRVADLVGGLAAWEAARLPTASPA